MPSEKLIKRDFFTKKKIINKEMHYSKTEVRLMARKTGIKKPEAFSKKQLCEIIGIPHIVGNRDGHKHSVTNIQTGEVEVYKSVGAIGKKISINTGKIFNRIKTKKPLLIENVKFIVMKV